MTADPIALARYTDAPAARAAARQVLAAGITPDVQREGDEHVLRVAPAEAARAAEILGLEAPAPSDEPLDETSDETVDGGAADGGDLPAPPAVDGTDSEPEPEADIPDVDDQGFVVVAVADDEAAGHAMAASLLENGIGVELGGAVDAGYANALMGGADAQVVRVLELDVERALGILGGERPRRLGPPVGTPTPAPIDPTTDGGPELATEAAPTPGRRIGAEKPREVREYFGGRLRLTKRQLWTGIIVYIAALILIPLSFFYLTRWALDPGGGDPADTIPGFTDTTED